MGQIQTINASKLVAIGGVFTGKSTKSAPNNSEVLGATVVKVSVDNPNPGQ